MNYKQKQQEIIRVRNLFDAKFPQGCVKLTSGESELHARVKTQVVHYLLNQNYECWTEAQFRDGSGRCDILALHKSGIAYCFEILVTESDKKLLNKSYPLEIIRVDANKFNYDTFKL